MSTEFQEWVAANSTTLALSYLSATDEYDKRNMFIDSAAHFLSNANDEDLTPSIVNALGIVVSDTFAELFIQSIVFDDKLLVAFANKISATEHEEAKSELAELLGLVESNKTDAIKVLEIFIGEKEEFISRKALLSLAKLGSDTVESHAENAWNTGLSYQRIACLHALNIINSTKLTEYFDHANIDGRLFVVQNMLEIRNEVA